MIATSPYLDTFTLYLRYAIAAFLSLLFLLFVATFVGTLFVGWWRRYQLKWHRRIYDWMIDGECDREPIDTEDMDPRVYLSVPDEVPTEWVQEWR